MPEHYAPSIGSVLVLPGEREYRLVSVLGTGRSGVVFQADALDGGASLAIKVARPGLSEELAVRLEEEAAFLKSFRPLLEGTVAARAVPELVASGREQGTVFVATELVGSQDAETLLTRGGVTSELELARLGQRVFTLLDVLHSQGRTYLDFKLENLHWNSETLELKVLDWNEVGTSEDDPGGASRDIFRAAVYLHGLVTGALLPYRGLQVTAPYDRSARWDRLSPFAKLVFETCFRSDVEGRYTTAAVAADFARLERLWVEASLAHAREILQNWTGLRGGPQDVPCWRLLVMEQKAGETLRMSAETSLAGEPDKRDEIVSILDSTLKGLFRDVARRDPISVARTFLMGGSLKEAIEQLQQAGPYHQSAVRWLATARLLAGEIESSETALASDRTRFVVNALEAAANGDWEEVQGLTQILVDVPPYASAASQLLSEAVLRVSMRCAADASRSGDSVAALEAFKKAEAAAERLSEPSIRALVEADIVLETLPREIGRLDHEVRVQESLDANSGPLMSEPAKGRLHEVVGIASKAGSAPTVSTTMLERLSAWARFALREGCLEEARLLAGVAIAHGCGSSEIDTIYRTALDRMRIGNMVRDGRVEAALGELRAVVAFPGDDQWASKIEEELSLRKRTELATLTEELEGLLRSGRQFLDAGALEGARETVLQIEGLFARIASGVYRDGTIEEYSRRLGSLRNDLRVSRRKREQDEADEVQKTYYRAAQLSVVQTDAEARRRLQEKPVLREWNEVDSLLSAPDRLDDYPDLRLQRGFLREKVREAVEKATKLEEQLQGCIQSEKWDEALVALKGLSQVSIQLPPALMTMGTTAPSVMTDLNTTAPRRVSLQGLEEPGDLASWERRCKVGQAISAARVRIDALFRSAEGAVEGNPLESDVRAQLELCLPEVIRALGMEVPESRSATEPAARLPSSGDPEDRSLAGLLETARLVCAGARAEAEERLQRQWGAGSTRQLLDLLEGCRLVDTCLRVKSLAEEVGPYNRKLMTKSGADRTILLEAQVIISDLLALRDSEGTLGTVRPDIRDLEAIKTYVGRLARPYGVSMVVKGEAYSARRLAESIESLYRDYIADGH